MLPICVRPERVWPKLSSIQGIRDNLVYIVSLVKVNKNQIFRTLMTTPLFSINSFCLHLVSDIEVSSFCCKLRLFSCKKATGANASFAWITTSLSSITIFLINKGQSSVKVSYSPPSPQTLIPYFAF